MIVDEMAYVPEDILKDTVLPVLRNEGSVLVACSTPEGPANFYTYMGTTLDAEGKPMHKRITMELICEACKQLDREDALKCNHMDHLRAAWHSTKNDEFIMSLVGNNSAVIARELMGVAQGSDAACFQQVTIDDLFNPENYVETESKTFPRVYITMDPSGGNKSYMGLCASVRLGEMWVVSYVLVWGCCGCY